MILRPNIRDSGVYIIKNKWGQIFFTLVSTNENTSEVNNTITMTVLIILTYTSFAQYTLII